MKRCAVRSGPMKRCAVRSGPMRGVLLGVDQ